MRDRYVSADPTMIKHYEFPDIFIRTTKKAYISIINKDIIDLAMSCPTVNLNNFRSFFTKRKIPLNMNYCRKIFATYLRNKGIEPEIIDLLQGRIPQSVFLRHYYRPNVEYQRIGVILSDLKGVILKG
ncbi:integrase [Candidatus Nitrosocosmicus sp. R]